MKDKKSVATDADIMWYGIDRVVHTKTGGGHEKVETYKDLGEALAKFEALRATMIDIHQNHQRRFARAQLWDPGGDRFLAVDARNLDSCRAPHSANSRDQGGP